MRARNIKPAFFKNYELADQGATTQLLFIGLWCLADKEGRLEDKPRFIKAEIFPYYDVDINRELTVIERLGNIRRYSCNGVDLIEVVNFSKHQRPHHTEKESVLPSYHEKDDPNDCKLSKTDNLRELTVNPPLDNREYPPDSLIPDSLIPDSLIPDSLIPDSLIPDYGQKDLPASLNHKESFLKFWEVYPRKVSQNNAKKAWAKIKPNNEMLAIILTALAKQKESSGWQKDDGQWIPYPATWLNGKRWEDQFNGPAGKAQTEEPFLGIAGLI